MCPHLSAPFSLAWGGVGWLLGLLLDPSVHFVWTCWVPGLRGATLAADLGQGRACWPGAPRPVAQGTPAARAGRNLAGVGLQFPWVPGASCRMGRVGPACARRSLFSKGARAGLLEGGSSAAHPGWLVSPWSVNIRPDCPHLGA